MSHFAQIDENNVVVNVIVAEQDFIDSGAVGDPSKWIQTSYNTFGGVHYTTDEYGREPSADQSKALRKNYAQIGGTYDPVNDAFIPIKPYSSWVLNSKFLWEPPVPYPGDRENPYLWDEETTSWYKAPK